MRNEEMIEDLFEAARSETSVRDITQVQAFMETVEMSGTHSNLIFKWLKQYKMNILLTSSTIIIATTILLFPETKVLPEQVELKQVETVEQEIAMTDPPTAIHEEESKKEVTQSLEVLEVAEESTPIKEIDPLAESSKIDSPPKGDSATGTLAVLRSMTTKAKAVAASSAQIHRTKVESEKRQSTEELFEHRIVLESKGGRESADKFEAYLRENLSSLDPQLKSTASNRLIRKFTLKLDNKLQANFQIRVSGFTKLELGWKTGANDEVSDLWFRLDEREISELDLSKESKSSIKVTLSSSEF